MARYFGVKCKENGIPIALELLDTVAPNEIVFNVLPLDPFECPACGQSHQYQAKEGFEFEADNPLAVQWKPENTSSKPTDL